jgi:hypothetical protein
MGMGRMVGSPSEVRMRVRNKFPINEMRMCKIPCTDKIAPKKYHQENGEYSIFMAYCLTHDFRKISG